MNADRGEDARAANGAVRRWSSQQSLLIKDSLLCTVINSPDQAVGHIKGR
jgi:hypothetical protein